MSKPVFQTPLGMLKLFLAFGIIVVGALLLQKSQQLTVNEFDDETNRYLSELASFTKDPTAAKACHLRSLYGDGSIETALVEAAAWYRQAAERGNVDALFMLGAMYDRGEGVEQDHEEAVRWFLKAAEQGCADAQFILGMMYSTGLDIPKDLQKGVKWYTEAAQQGHADAQFYLGWMYADGRGVDQDVAAAKMWYQKAEQNGCPYAWEALEELSAPGRAGAAAE